MDNIQFTVTGTGAEAFKTAMTLLMNLRGFHKATHFASTPEHGLVLFWTDPCLSAAQPLPYPMKGDSLVDFAFHWLQDGATYGSQPDHDGENERGWVIYVESWGHVMKSPYAICGVRPYWACYGK